MTTPALRPDLARPRRRDDRACSRSRRRSHAQAPVWPTKPVKIVIAYPPGGSTDIAGRLLADKLTKNLGQQFVVENRGGAGGTIGALSVVRADPDGYTLLLGGVAGSLDRADDGQVARLRPGEGPDADHARGLGAVLPRGVPGLPAQHAGRARRLRQGQPRQGQLLVVRQQHVEPPRRRALQGHRRHRAVHVPYKGSGPSIIDLMGGQVQYTFDTPAATAGHVKAGKLKAIGVATPQRLANAPTFRR